MAHIRVQLDVTEPNGDVVTYVFHKVDTSDTGWCDLRVEPIYPDITSDPFYRVRSPIPNDLILSLRGRLLSIDESHETHRLTRSELPEKVD